MAVIIVSGLMAKNRGFTYIEVLIVVGIISLLSVGGVASYSEFQARKQTEAETRMIESYIELAREKTSAGDRTGSCGTYGGYYSVTSTGAVVSLVPNGCSAAASFTLRSGYTLPEGDIQADFRPLGAGYSGPSCIIVQHPNAELCGQITIESSGITSSEVRTECTCP
jgi:prepilin-type N-terminal cleavage/methylation domain-containing protein